MGLIKETYLSKLLLNVVLEAIVRRAELQTTGTIFNINKQTQFLAYVDDIEIVGRNLEAVHDAYLALETETAKIGLEINIQLTKYMIAAGNRTIRDAQHTVAFGNKNLEVVDKFVLLGALVTPKNDVGLEIQRRIQTANRCLACENICS
jgi:hypothetical protein